MNKLPEHKRIQLLHMLVEGSSMRSVSRVVSVSMNTVVKLLVDAGEACTKFHDEHVREVQVSCIQCDEIWSFCYAKAKNVGMAEAAPVVDTPSARSLPPAQAASATVTSHSITPFNTCILDCSFVANVSPFID